MASHDGPRTACRVRVRGLVQGVGFRPFVYRLAHRLGLTGNSEPLIGDFLAQTLGHPNGVRCIRVRHGHHELLSAKAGGDVEAAHGLCETAAELLQCAAFRFAAIGRHRFLQRQVGTKQVDTSEGRRLIEFRTGTCVVRHADLLRVIVPWS